MTGPDDVVHRGIRWQRSAGGSLRWWDPDRSEWVRVRGRRPSPPLPPGWESRRPPSPALRLQRPPWRSPYRIVPLVVLAGIVVAGVVQATSGTGGQAGAEARLAAQLVGRCLQQQGGDPGRPQYAPSGVACSAVGAAVRVTAALPGTPGSPPCPQGTTGVVLAYPGVRYPHQLCVVANGGR